MLSDAKNRWVYFDICDCFWNSYFPPAIIHPKSPEMMRKGQSWMQMKREGPKLDTKWCLKYPRFQRCTFTSLALVFEPMSRLGWCEEELVRVICGLLNEFKSANRCLNGVWEVILQYFSQLDGSLRYNLISGALLECRFFVDNCW